jgi:histone-lysine N-methyltransferase SETMAR
VLLPNNALSHTAAHTIVTLKKLNFEVLEHPPYSSDLARSDCHLFDPIQPALRGRHFTTEQQLKETVHVWLVSQPKAFYSEGI